jgi:hypothetical protein
MISASLDAWLRASSTSQPKTRTMIRYRRRSATDRDLAPTRPFTQTAGQHRCDEFWSGTRNSTAGHHAAATTLAVAVPVLRQGDEARHLGPAGAMTLTCTDGLFGTRNLTNR